MYLGMRSLLLEQAQYTIEEVQNELEICVILLGVNPISTDVLVTTVAITASGKRSTIYFTYLYCILYSQRSTHMLVIIIRK